MSYGYLPLYRQPYGGACFDPATLAVASIAATVASAGISYMGAQQTAQAQSAAAEYNAQVATNNQKIANQAAVAAQQEGAVEQQQKAYQEDVLIGQEKAGLAANGLDVGSGTAVNILSDTKAAGELDQLTLINNAQRQTQGFLNQGINYGNQAQIDKAGAAATLQGGELKAAASLASGAGQVSNQWYNYSNNVATASSTSGIDTTSTWA